MFVKSKNTYKKDVSKSLNEISSYCSIIRDYFLEKSSIINGLCNNKEIINFLKSCNKDTYTIKHENYDSIINLLKNTKEENEEIYLCFIGLWCNGDAIDNNGRSRQHECKEGLRKSYIAGEREWYIETLANPTKHTATITSPYRDTSGSYVISITQEIIDEHGSHLGIVGIDVLIRNIVLKLNSKNHIIIITNTGEIVYNSETYIADILEKQNNIVLTLGPDILDIIISRESGYKYTQIYGMDCLVSFKQLIKNKYYILTVYK